jgi:hypothetical protein
MMFMHLQSSSLESRDLRRRLCSASRQEEEVLAVDGKPLGKPEDVQAKYANAYLPDDSIKGDDC